MHARNACATRHPSRRPHPRHPGNCSFRPLQVAVGRRPHGANAATDRRRPRPTSAGRRVSTAVSAFAADTHSRTPRRCDAHADAMREPMRMDIGIDVDVDMKVDADRHRDELRRHGSCLAQATLTYMPEVNSLQDPHGPSKRGGIKEPRSEGGGRTENKPDSAAQISKHREPDQHGTTDPAPSHETASVASVAPSLAQIWPLRGRSRQEIAGRPHLRTSGAFLRPPHSALSKTWPTRTHTSPEATNTLHKRTQWVRRPRGMVQHCIGPPSSATSWARKSGSGNMALNM